MPVRTAKRIPIIAKKAITITNTFFFLFICLSTDPENEFKIVGSKNGGFKCIVVHFGTF